MLKIGDEIMQARNGVLVAIGNTGEDFLRFSVYVSEEKSSDPDNGYWEEKSSWQTRIPVDIDDRKLEKALNIILTKMCETLREDVNAPVYRTGDELALLSEKDLM